MQTSSEFRIHKMIGMVFLTELLYLKSEPVAITRYGFRTKKGVKMYEKYAKIRDEKGVTDYKVAIETGISKSTFSDWKSKRSKPKLEKLLKISEFLGCKLEALI